MSTEYFDEVKEDCKNALELTLKLPFAVKIQPAYEKELFELGLIGGRRNKELPIVITERENWYVDADLLSRTYGDLASAKSQLARCMLYAGVMSNGLRHVKGDAKKGVLSSPYSIGPAILATSLGGIFLQDRLNYDEFPSRDEDLISAITSESSTSALTYGQAKRFYIESGRKEPTVGAFLFTIWDSSNHQNAFEKMMKLSYKQMVLQSVLRRDLGHYVLRSNLEISRWEVKKLLDGVIADVETRKKRWQDVKPKLRAISEMLSDFDIGRPYAERIAMLLNENDIDYETVSKSPEYETVLKHTIADLDKKFSPEHGEKEPETEEEKITAIDFPNIIAFDEL